MHFSIRFGIDSKEFDTSLFGVLFEITQTAPSRSGNSSFIFSSEVFIKAQKFQWGSDPDCALAMEQIGCHYEFPFIYGMESMDWSIVVNQLESQFQGKN